MEVSFSDVAAKLEAGERLSDEDIDTLEADRDIVALGMLADGERRKRHGGRVTYVRVADWQSPAGLGPHARLPRMGPKPGPTDAGPGFSPADAGEVRIVSVPASLDTAAAWVSDARDAAGKIPLSGFSLADLDGLQDPLPVVLKALKDAGLALVAHAPLDKLKHPERAMEAVADAGLELARVTIEEVTNRRWSDVCRQVAAIQRKIQSFRAFAPLPRTLNLTQPTTGYEDVKRVALSRLLVGDVETIQVDWALYGPKLAQVALMFGGDDIDGVSADDDESQGHRRSPHEEIRRSIQAAGFEPVERNARFWY